MGWGLGHLRRSSVLIRELRKRGLKVAAVAVAPSLSDRSDFAHILERFDERVESLADLKVAKPLLAVVDIHPDCQPEMITWLKYHDIKAIALDWYMDQGGVIESTVNLLGDEAAISRAIIADEFLTKARKRTSIRGGYNIVAVMGGGDLRNHLPRLMRSFAHAALCSTHKITVVIGPLVRGSIDMEEKSFRKIDILVNPSHIADVMARATVGICNAGTILLEFSAMGVPTVILPQTELEDRFSLIFVRNGCSILGEADPYKFAVQLEALLADPTRLDEMGARGKKLVDGRGKQRIADEVECFLKRHS